MNRLSFPVQFVICEESDYLPMDPGYVDLRVQMKPLSYEERLAAWTSLVPESVAWPSKEFYELILRYQSTIGQIASVGRRHCISMSDAYEVLRAEGGMRLGKLARPANAAFRWSDLVLPAHLKRALEDFQFEASERTLFWEQPNARRLFMEGRGLIALFNGPPGTGKTMAAQILAAELQLEIYRIDLSTVVSKYVGESSKNIERILSAAKHMDVVLLFDEADALFGKRTEVKDAHDRYANMETNFLLQAIEQYPGIVILSCNKKSGIDPAFMRRFRYVLEFPKPDRAQRLSLWKNLTREMVGEHVQEELLEQLHQLADQLELTGAQIKLSILSALFIAKKERVEIGMEHLVTGVERELMKEGKTLGNQLTNYSRTV
jgi:DNA polymerase III delta prime subunit